MMPSCASPLYAATKQAFFLRYYQNDLIDDIQAHWLMGYKCVLAVLATGGGKTVALGDIVSHHKGAACISAHRQELVSQISLALAKFGIRHRIVAPDKIIKGIIRLHVEEIGTNFISPTAPVGVASVDTLIRKGTQVVESWMMQVTLLVHDEAHHVLRENKWGKATNQFKNKELKILSLTATPERADGKGLGSHADGIADVMVEGPGSRQLIDEGYLTPYKVVLAESDIRLTEDMKSKDTGDFNQQKLKAAVRGSHIVGDVVKAYQTYTPGEPALVFASDVETSIDMAANFRKASIRALHIDADTPDDVRDDAKRKLKRGELDVLCNVGLFGEGYDLPLIVAVYDCAATESYANYAQRFGRMLRLSIAAELMANWDYFTIAERKAHIAASSKPYGVYIDLVGNMFRHRGPPDRPRQFTLDSCERKGGSSDAILTTTCSNKNANDTGYACAQTYERFRVKCPYCGFKPEPTARSGPEFVGGDWRELDADTCRRMWGEVIDVEAPFVYVQGTPLLYARAHANHHVAKQLAQKDLREAFAWWGGERRSEGLSDTEIIREFYYVFKIDTLTAWALPRAEAVILTEKIDSVLTESSLRSRIRYV